MNRRALIAGIAAAAIVGLPSRATFAQTPQSEGYPNQELLTERWWAEYETTNEAAPVYGLSLVASRAHNEDDAKTFFERQHDIIQTPIENFYFDEGEDLDFGDESKLYEGQAVQGPFALQLSVLIIRVDDVIHLWLVAGIASQTEFLLEFAESVLADDDSSLPTSEYVPEYLALDDEGYDDF